MTIFTVIPEKLDGVIYTIEIVHAVLGHRGSMINQSYEHTYQDYAHIFL